MRPTPDQAVDPLKDRYRALFEAAGAEIPPDDDPAHLPAARLLAAHATAFGAAEALEPLYVRAPDAVPAR